MKCLRCNNEDMRYFGCDHGTWYCRKCVALGRLDVGQEVIPATLSKRVWKGKPSLQYELTSAQKKVSNQALQYLKQGKDVFVYAATGAGKTEITFESICWYLSQGKKVGFAISRRQVVLEIAQRLRVAFPKLSVVEVCQEFTKKTDADLIVCTTHQLYRYPYGFDLLILDELDAFPYVNNDLLQSLSRQACKGQRLLLSATPDEKSKEEMEQHRMEMVCLFERPHRHPLCVPKVKMGFKWMQCVYLISLVQKFKKENKQVLVFVPKKSDCMWVSMLLRLFVKVRYIHSEIKDKDACMKDFKGKKFHVLVSTTLLERGITVPSVQVIVLFADHIVFTTASLIQIYGRVGRSFQDPDGEGYCLCQFESHCIKECIRQIQWMNDCAYTVSK